MQMGFCILPEVKKLLYKSLSFLLYVTSVSSTFNNNYLKRISSFQVFTLLFKMFKTLLTLVLAVQLCCTVLSYGGEDGGFRVIGLKWHNMYRKEVGATPLALDQELNKVAHAHAEYLATSGNFNSSNSGYRENLWAYRGELRPLAKDLEYAIKSWYTGSSVPGNIVGYSVDDYALRNSSLGHVGFGVGTTDNKDPQGLQGYTVVVAVYSE